MKDPVKLGEDTVIDRAAIHAVRREGSRLLICFGGERPMVITDEFTREEIEELTKSER